MRNNLVRIGTRGSQLALYQAHRVRDALLEAHHGLEVEIKIIKTKGDKVLDVALSKIGDKGLFTKELETELLQQNIDVAVHSLKDLPTVFPEGLSLAGVLKRGEFRDALVHQDGKKFHQLDTRDVVATSSLRRRAQLLKHFPDLTIVDIRGNVNTRLKKMQQGHCTAMIMAAAGLQRIQMGHLISEILDPEEFIPAVSQGAIAMQTRTQDPDTHALIQSITHAQTLKTITAERTFLRMMEGGCQIPVGCFSQIIHDQYRIKGFISSLDASDILQDERTGAISQATELAADLAQSFIDRGSKQILEKIRNHNQMGS